MSRALPGGAATGGATQYEMLRRAGFVGTRTTTALTAVGLLSTLTLFTLPLLALPAMFFGIAIDSRLLSGVVVAAILAVILLSGSSVLLISDRVVGGIGRLIDWVIDRVKHETPEPPFADAAGRRRATTSARRSPSRGTRAVPAAFGNQLFDYGALLVSIYAIGASVDPALVLLAFVVASTLAMIPLTPGGLGFVEAGLTGMLTLAGLTPAAGRAEHPALPVVLVLAAAAGRCDRVVPVRPAPPPPARRAGRDPSSGPAGTQSLVRAR